MTTHPELYRRRAVRARLLPVLARLPQPFFRRLVTERDFCISVTAGARGLGDHHPDDPPDVIHGAYTVRMQDLTGRPLDAWRVVLSRVAIELEPPAAFTGAFVHECCHVYLGHSGDDGADPEEQIQRREDEAVALACDLGFRRETKAMLDCWRRNFGEGGLMGRLPPPTRRRP